MNVFFVVFAAVPLVIVKPSEYLNCFAYNAYNYANHNCSFLPLTLFAVLRVIQASHFSS